MNTKFVLKVILLAFLLTGCNLVSPTMVTTTISTAAPTLEFVQSTPAELPFTPSIPPTTSPTAIVIPSCATPSSVNQTVLDRASEAIQALENQNLVTLSTYVHPQLGLRFSPYAAVKDTDQVFTADQVASLVIDSKVYTWGQYSGSGAPIDLGFPAYYSSFVYDVNFAEAPQLALNHRLGVSTTMDNSLEYYPGAMIVEYYFPGFDPQLQGMDWRSLRLVFIQENNTWYLVGIIHDQWTT
jgi:hypothetical protein